MEKHKISQMIELLLAMQEDMKAHQARMEADNKAWREKMRAETEAIRAETETIRARTKATRDKRMEANRDACIEDIKNDGKETTACQDAMEGNREKIEPNPGEKEAVVEGQEICNEEVAINSLWACQNERTPRQEATKANPEKMESIDRVIAILEQMIAMTKLNQEKIATTDLKGNPEEIECEEPTSVDMEPEMAHEEVPKEEAVVMPVGEPRDRRRDRRHLAAQRRQKKQQERTQSKNECGRNLVAARRGTTRRAAVARHRRIFFHK
jgi:hypothetical protein